MCGQSFGIEKRKTGEKKAHHQVRSNSGHVSGRLAVPTTSVKRGVSSNILRYEYRSYSNAPPKPVLLVTGPAPHHFSAYERHDNANAYRKCIF
jgi:hypothetical protein